MKTLVVYFTRTNTTKILAEEIGKRLDATVELLKDKRNWSGVLGFLSGGRAALKKEMTEIEELENRIEDFDLLVIGTPVWVGTMPPAIRTFISNNKSKLKKMAIFMSQGSAEKQRIFSDIKELSGIEPIAELFCSTKSVRSGAHETALTEFVNKIKANEI